MRIASYNVHGCIGRDGLRDVPRIARVLQKLEADVVALQELACHGETLGPIQVLSELTGLTPIWTPTWYRDGVHFGNALLTTFPVLQQRTLDLTCYDREPRSALDVMLDAPPTRLRVIATHLGLWPAERRKQVRRILDSTEHAPDTVTVMLGDINEWWIHGRPLRWLHAHFGRSPALRTFPAWCPVFALDRIWVHPPELLVEASAYATAETRVASDHLPVVAELAL
ncbi:MAG TPA: endonuclease/exonuclease/phosphatase family protein [Polyangiales bacterium]|jgi:endonuclease/exonuclease/phosphatase family metal-dependent hydrolase|nr:endonuclease/exonuclease/phosphatase family protein [Polyangiales bacterium]